MTDIEARLRAVPPVLVCQRFHVHASDYCYAIDYPALAAVVQGMVADQAREVEGLNTGYQEDRIEWDQQYEGLTGEIERLRGALSDALDIVKHQAPDLYEAMDDCRAALRATPEAW